MRQRFTVNASALDRAHDRLVAEARQTPQSELIRRGMASFVRNLVAITAPNTGALTSAGRRRGEAAIRSDLSNVFIVKSIAAIQRILDFSGREGILREHAFGPSRRSKFRERTVTLTDRFLIGTSLSQMGHFHEAKRLDSTGRVSRAGTFAPAIGRHVASDLMIVSPALFDQYLRQVWGRVGILAAGYNAAALYFGADLPAWIRRHGDSHGSCLLKFEGDKMTVNITNAVPFIDHVRDLRPKVEAALVYTTASFERQLQAIADKRRAI